MFPAKTKSYVWNGVATPYPEIRLLAVIPELQSRGVGTALVEHCLDISKSPNNSMLDYIQVVL
nr:GNAT family N-acetyltransferase [Planococcus versutus]